MSFQRSGVGPSTASIPLDMRYAIRRLRHDPGLVLLVTLTLALGVGVNSAIFSLVINGFHRPLPVRDPGRLVVLATRHQAAAAGMEGMQYRFTYPELADFRAQARSYTDIIAYDLGHGGLDSGGKPEEFFFSFVSGNYFSALGVEPAAGRLFTAGEGETPDSAIELVLGYSCWQKRFGGDPAVIGRQVRLNGAPVTIIGVTAQRFHGTFANTDMQGFVPLSYVARVGSGGLRNFFHDRATPKITLMGRLKPGVTLAEAQSEALVIAGRLERQYPATDKGISVAVLPEAWARPAPIPSMVAMAPFVVALFLGLGGLVLVMACMNVGNILLVRSAVREREMAVRAALGSGRARLVRQVLIESLLLALLGGAAGVILGTWATDAISAIPVALGNLPAVLDVSLDWRAFLYALAITFLAGIGTGLWPALVASRAEIAAVLHEGGWGISAARGSRRLGNLLVVAQVAGSLTLLIVAGCLAVSLANARRMNLGFDPSHLANFVMDTEYAGYDEARGVEFHRELLRRVRALPGVESASLAFAMPMSYVQEGDSIDVEGRPPTPGRDRPLVMFNSVTPDYLKTMRIKLRAGRELQEADREDAPRVAMINQVMANRLWPGRDPVGKRFRMQRAGDVWWEVAGVVSDGKYFALFEPPLPYFYVPSAQMFRSRTVLQVRSPLAPETLIKSVEGEIRALDPSMPVTEARMMDEALEGATGYWGFRLAAYVSGVMGLVGLALAAVGVYGVVSYAARQRTREIGIRMAVGAEARDVFRMVLGRGVALVSGGVLAGVAFAWVLARMMNRWLSAAVEPDPVVFIGISVLLAALAMWACFVPARRATRLDPMQALRHE